MKISLTNEQYHADTEFVTSSMLKTLAKSPRLYEAKYIKGKVIDGPKQAFKVGNAVHAAALEPEEFAKDYVITDLDMRKKEGRDFAKENAGKTILKGQEAETVRECVASLLRNPICSKLIEADGLVEDSVFLEDEATGVKVKCRCDKFIPKTNVVFDIKTTASWDNRRAAQNFHDLGYHIQQAHYTSILAEKRGVPLSEFRMVFGVVEKVVPYRCRAVELSAEFAELGHDIRNDLLIDLKDRVAEDIWCDDDEFGLLELELPRYVSLVGE